MTTEQERTKKTSATVLKSDIDSLIEKLEKTVNKFKRILRFSNLINFFFSGCVLCSLYSAEQ